LALSPLNYVGAENLETTARKFKGNNIMRLELNRLAEEAGMPPEDFIKDLFSCITTYASMTLPTHKSEMRITMDTIDEFNWEIVVTRELK